MLSYCQFGVTSLVVKGSCLVSTSLKFGSCSSKLEGHSAMGQGGAEVDCQYRRVPAGKNWGQSCSLEVISLSIFVE